MNTSDINSKVEGFISPPYTDRDASMIFLSFESEEQYESWFNENPKTHCNWLKKDTIKMTSEPLFELDVVTKIVFVCTHSGKPRSVKTQDTTAVPVRSEAALTKKRRVNKASIKCGCTARIVKKMLTNKTIEVIYTWKHINHDPSKITEVLNERMDPEVIHWVKGHHMDWKSIKNVLRLKEDNLDDIETTNVLPFSMLNRYKTVQNVIAAHFTELSRKHTNVIRSLELWIKYLCEEKGYMAEYIQYPGEGAPFLIHWMSSWQMNVS
ncbi:hypothetical protein BD770DRAFT_93248 [Pilaira anomala]|nr:hypothetical protein BD770DRAFT_93248 [Pilaira anomala]